MRLLRTKGRKAIRVFLASVLVALVSGATAAAQTPVVERPSVEDLVDPPAKCANIIDANGWGRIGLPNFSRGEQVAQSYTVDAYNKKRLFVTNGIEIYRSMNSGCSWTKVYELPETPSQNQDYSELDSRIEQVTVPKGTTGDRLVYFTLDQFRAPEGLVRGTRSRVFRSENNGNSWVAADGTPPEVLPPHGGPEQLVPTPAFPEVLYLLMEAPDVQYLATSPDGGETWETRGPICIGPVIPSSVPDTPVLEGQAAPGVGCVDPDEPAANPGVPADVAGIEIDPFEPNEVWFYGPRGLERSANSGVAPKKIEQIKEPIGAVDVFKTAGGEARIVATGSQAPSLHISEDGGETWEDIGTDGRGGIVDSIAKGRVSNEFFISTDQGVFLHLYGSPLDISPTDRRTIMNIQSARTLGGGASLCVYGSSGTFLEGGCLVTTRIPPPPPPPVIDPIPPGGGNFDTEAARFDPENLVITLDRGESRVVPYTLNLFKSPTPLDVYFLIDISGSMQNTIDGVARGLRKIIGALMEDKIDTHFGLGVYRAYDSAPAYRRIIDISPPGKPLQRALETLIANSGGEETQLEALYQSATGAGQEESLIGGANIPPNQQASFREEALKVIIHATDEKFSVLPPNPSFDQVITELNEKTIEQVGLAIQYPDDGGSEDDPEYVQVTPRQGLARVAEGTQTFAVEDVDCNDDGDIDIEAGNPLVCDINPERAQESALMSGAIVELLNSVEDIGDVQVNISAAPGVVSNISNRIFSPINFKKPPVLSFEVMYTCPIDGTEKEYPVQLSAQARGVAMAYTTATVRCREEGKPLPPVKKDPKPIPEEEEDPPRPPAILTPFFPIPAFAPPIVRPPEMSPNPGPQSQSQTQSQSQAQAQNAMARQKQEQVQLAYAYSKSLKAELAAERATNRAGEDLNMSKYRSTSSRRQEQVPPGLALMLTSSAMTLAAGIAATRYKTRPQHARRNRRRY